MVVDCTVIQIKRPKEPFEDAKVYFSGKHFIYCLKKEVFVNIRSGTAALVSKGFPGSAHDMHVLSSHHQEVRDMIGDIKVLADLGYTGGERYVPGMVVCSPSDLVLKRRSVIVEQFFGRLKGVWRAFSGKWLIDEAPMICFFVSPARSPTLTSSSLL